MILSLQEVQDVLRPRIEDWPQTEPGRLAERVKGFSIDSRTVREGELFFAIKGDRYDGHAFLGGAFERGAIAAVVSEPLEPGPRLLFQVPDTLGALQSLAKWGRERWARPVVGITGSAGKTSTKDVTAALLGKHMRVGKTRGNLNNHIGLPLTLLQVSDHAEVAILELGMNHAGEIRFLATIAKPDIAVVTNVGSAHIGAFSSIEELALAKRELIESLSISGVAVLNADDERVAAFRQIHPGRTITYGLSCNADVHATDLTIAADRTTFAVDQVPFETRLIGRHGLQNVLAAISVATLFDLRLPDLADAVAELAPGKMRGERSQWRGMVLINDCYNSNPEAARSMIDLLVVQVASRYIAVLGEMLELGTFSEALHRSLGSYACRAGVDVLIGVGDASRFMIEGALEAGLAKDAAYFFERPEAAGAFLRDFSHPGDVILFKGSRGSRVELVLSTMQQDAEPPGQHLY